MEAAHQGPNAYKLVQAGYGIAPQAQEQRETERDGNGRRAGLQRRKYEGSGATGTASLVERKRRQSAGAQAELSDRCNAHWIRGLSNEWNNGAGVQQ
jgi:hypothetical protein